MPTRILQDRCTACGICVFQCGGSVYDVRLQDHDVQVEVSRPKDCVDCCICMERCPENAIELFFKGAAYTLGTDPA